MTRFTMYMAEPVAVLCEQRKVCGAWTTVRFVSMYGERVTRGGAGMYPALPRVAPVEIDEQTFSEAWEQGA